MFQAIRFFVSVSLVALIAGCAVPVKEPPPGRPAILSQEYLQSGMRHEAAGEMIAALRDFELALTVDPRNSEASGNRDRLQAEIQASARKHYDKGMALKRKGRYSSARKEFLTTLRLYPDFQEARAQLIPDKQIIIKGYLIHRVKPGDTLSKLAALYYKDYRKFPIIARYNQIDDAAALGVGQDLKIPELEEVKSMTARKGTEQKLGTTDSGSLDQEIVIAEADHMGPATGSELILKRDEEEQVAIYRNSGVELFNNKEYARAVIEFNKVLSSNPDDPVALDYLYRCFFQQALALYSQKKYLAARDQFKLSLRYRNDCQQCHRYLNQCESSYLKYHYKRGMEFYDNKMLQDAIGEWELVKKERPNYKRVNYLINKARTIQKKLEELKKREKPGEQSPDPDRKKR
ncbi:MAG: LysM peptidoglycan-binding domain-containing protein [Deltaproteobacteria bacterium]|nr:LysM peptidoglycan-binding domain-containing protein [Deltaproteobacteria bacterium]MBW2110892.1 LysM peptidoglycan-binding domain-containing protein [Deltaproteobacteria bacterium]MBW2354261.1 LysM peptidoglycan-binding domain-containing protein [Deltaproteobacteria bacterium]HDZ90647.1 LysM domain-containing protein [Deltaproteobacteria bacterium]